MQAASLAESPVTVSTLGQPDTRHPGGKLNVWDIKTNKVRLCLRIVVWGVQIFNTKNFSCRCCKRCLWAQIQSRLAGHPV